MKNGKQGRWNNIFLNVLGICSTCLKVFLFWDGEKWTVRAEHIEIVKTIFNRARPFLPPNTCTLFQR